MSRLYCPECGEYLMAGDGECHDCHCGWKQYTPKQAECSGCGSPRILNDPNCDSCEHISDCSED